MLYSEIIPLRFESHAKHINALWAEYRISVCSSWCYRGPGFDSRRYQIFCVVLGLERGPLSLVSLVRSIEALLE
jgi:hypothetical protein